MADIITMPDECYKFSSMQFNLVTLTTKSGPSSFNPIASVDGPNAYLWRAVLTFTPKGYADVDEIERFLTRLRGGSVFARIYHVLRVAPKGAGGVTTTVNVRDAAAAGATTLVVKNLVPSQAQSLRSMDHIEVGANLYRVVDSGPSDVAGEGAFEIWPPLRTGVAPDDPINLSKPTGVFSLVDGQDSMSIEAPFIYQGLTLTFQEMPDFS